MSSVSTSTASVTTAGRTAAASPKTMGRHRPGRRTDRSIGTQWACLVLAPNASRREALERSTREAGWTPIVCASTVEASEQLDRWRSQLAAVDLGGVPADDQPALREFAESASAHDRLLAVVDDDGSAGVELWARETGAWVYLPAPELGEDNEADLTGFFVEARAAAEKLASRPVAAT